MRARKGAAEEAAEGAAEEAGDIRACSAGTPSSMRVVDDAREAERARPSARKGNRGDLGGRPAVRSGHDPIARPDRPTRSPCPLTVAEIARRKPCGPA
jgi:hypothetical protein